MCEEFAELLRILDHPQAVYILQRRFCSRLGGKTHIQDTADVTPPLHRYASPVDTCSRCSHVNDILCNVKELSNVQHSLCSTESSCTLYAMLKLIQAISSPSTSGINVNSLSSTALHNLLILMEQNWNSLHSISIEEFLITVEQSEVAAGDSWCSFLIDCLKRRMGCLEACPLVSLGEQSVKLQLNESVSLADDYKAIVVPEDSERDELMEISCASGSGNNDEQMEGVAMGKEENVEEIVKAEAVSSQNELSSSSQTVTGQHREAVEVSSHVQLVSKIYQEWCASKPAEQGDFNVLCSLSNDEFSASLDILKGSSVPESCITGINRNMSSLEVSLSYHNATAFIKMVILPMVLDLKQTASRDLISGLYTINSSYPDPFTQGLLHPLLQHKNFGAFHSNLVVKVLEDSATRPQLEEVWMCLVNAERSDVSLVWTEDLISVALFLVQQKVTLAPSTAGRLVDMLQQSAASLKKSSKFAKLVIELCKSQHHKDLISSYRAVLMEVADGHQSILKSSLLREVKKLSQS